MPGESLRKTLGLHVKRGKCHLEQASEEPVSADTLTLDGPTSRQQENLLLLSPPPDLWFLPEQSQHSKAVCTQAFLQRLLRT